MRIRLLGEVSVSGEPADGSSPTAVVATPRLRLCLATIALWRGSVSVDALAEVVWNGSPPENWKAALRNAVAKLRGQLEPVGGGGEALIATTPSGYRLAAGHIVDVTAAFADVEAADDALAAGDPDRAVELAGRAADGLTESLAPGLDVDGLIAHRTRIQSTALRALQVAAAASTALGRHGEAVGFAERAVAADTLREEAHRLLIAAHLAAGDRSDALRAYERCRRTLADELGVRPADRTVELYREALGTEPPAGSGHADGPFVGRRTELDTLASWARPGAVVSLVGPGGIGKSRLARELVDHHRGRFDGGRFVVDLEALDDETVAVAVVTAVGARPAPGASDVDVLTAALGGHGPTLVVLDGVDHCVDTVALLASELVARCPDVAVVATGRGPVGVPGERVLTVGGLDVTTDGPACFAAYAEAAGIDLASGAAAEQAVVELCRAVDGNPLGIELSARQAGLVSLPDLVDRLDPGGATSPLAAVIASSVDLLDEHERRVFARLAVIAGSADLALVQAVVSGAGVPARRVVRILAHLAERGLVVVDRRGVRWRYELHPVLSSTARARLGRRGIGDSSRRLSAALFARLPDTPTAPPPLGAIGELLPAIRGYLAGALRGESDMDDALRLAYWLHRYWAAGGVDEGIRWLRRLLAAATPDAPGRGHAEFALGYLLVWAGRPDEAAESLGRAATLLERTGDPMVPAVHFFLATTHENRRPDLARLHFAKAIDAANATGNTDVATVCLGGLGVVEFEGGDFDAGLAHFEQSLAAREAADPRRAAEALPQHASMLISVDRLDDADQALRRAERLLGDEVRIAAIVAATTRARLERLRGRPAVARRHADRASKMVDSTGARRVDSMPRVTLALLDLDAGDAESAAAGLFVAAKSAAEAQQPALLADVLDAATLVAATLAPERAAVLAGAAEALRQRAAVVRGRPEQRELDAAVARVRAPDWERLHRTGAAVEPMALADLVGSLAGCAVTD